MRCSAYHGQGDVRDAGAVAAVVGRCDVVVHLAAETHVDRSIADAQPFITTNVAGTQTLLDACRLHGRIERFVMVSTDEVYGTLPLDRPDLLFDEASPIAPSSPYAASKAAADLLCQAAHKTYGMDVVITRASNNFGSHQFPEKVIPLFVTNLLDGKVCARNGCACMRRALPCPACVTRLDSPRHRNARHRTCRCTGTGSTCATGCTSTTTARAFSSPSSAAAPVTFTTLAGATSAATEV
jgi:hypothetical protein